MAIPLILAMTGAEISKNKPSPKQSAYLSCHFSDNGMGLSNIPAGLSPGSVVIVDDQTAIRNHDPEQILRQLTALAPGSVLFDLQRTPTKEAMNLIRSLCAGLPCPTAAPPDYGKEMDCEIFLPPIPPHISPEEYLSPWQDRQVWLEIALDASEIIITADGSSIISHPFAKPAAAAHWDSNLLCRYSITQTPEEVRFYLYRTLEDLPSLLDIPYPCIHHAVGLYQELGRSVKDDEPLSIPSCISPGV